MGGMGGKSGVGGMVGVGGKNGVGGMVGMGGKSGVGGMGWTIHHGVNHEMVQQVKALAPGLDGLSSISVTHIVG